MAAINLKEHYPTTYTEDFLVEVSEEIHQLLADLKRQEDALLRKISRHHAYHSLDDPDFPVKQCVLFFRHLLSWMQSSNSSSLSIFMKQSCR